MSVMVLDVGIQSLKQRLPGESGAISRSHTPSASVIGKTETWGLLTCRIPCSYYDVCWTGPGHMSIFLTDPQVDRVVAFMQTTQGKLE